MESNENEKRRTMTTEEMVNRGLHIFSRYLVISPASLPQTSESCVFLSSTTIPSNLAPSLSAHSLFFSPGAPRLFLSFSHLTHTPHSLSLSPVLFLLLTQTLYSIFYRVYRVHTMHHIRSENTIHIYTYHAYSLYCTIIYENIFYHDITSHT